MKTFLVVCALVGFVAGQYHYNAPATSYGVPVFGSSGSFSSGSNSGGSSGGVSGGNYQIVKSEPTVSHSFQSAESTQSASHNYQAAQTIPAVQSFQTLHSAPSVSFQSAGSYQGSSGGYQGGNNGYQGGNSGYQSVSYNQGSDSGHRGVSSGFQSGESGFSGSGSGYQSSSHSVSVVQQPAQVFKHVFVHAAPEEPTPNFRQQVVLPAPQKHYKVIFIKTPSAPAAAPQIVPVPTQNEEKTVVYVLSKKAEQQAQNIVVPKVEAKAPSKPDVFFIKYNNKEENSVINNIVSDFNNKQPGQVTFSGLETGGESGGSFVSGSGSQGFSGGDSGSFNGGSGSSFLGSNVGGGSDASRQVTYTVQNGGSSGGSSGGSFGGSFGTSSGGSSSGFSSGSNGKYEDVSINTVASQVVPHESYGTPSFRSH